MTSLGEVGGDSQVLPVNKLVLKVISINSSQVFKHLVNLALFIASPKLGMLIFDMFLFPQVWERSSA